MTQHFDDGKKLVHVWNPWCGSVNEAKAIVDKLVDHVAGSTRVRGIIKQP
jgi:thiol-disulfide isomerase/thioredoxin